MNAPSHEDMKEMLRAAALEALDSADLERVLAHARDCEECARLLGEYREVAAALTLLLPRRQLDPARSVSLRARLTSRALADLRARAGDPAVSAVAHRYPRAISVADRWTGWMVAAALAGVLLMHHAVHRPLNYGWLAAGALTVVLVALGVYTRIQRGRVSALRDRLDALERTTIRRDEGVRH